MRQPELSVLFGRRSAEAQGRMLLEAVVAVVDHLQDMPWLDHTLRALGARHVDYGVTEEMYPLVASALIDTLAERQRRALERAHRRRLERRAHVRRRPHDGRRPRAPNRSGVTAAPDNAKCRFGRSSRRRRRRRRARARPGTRSPTGNRTRRSRRERRSGSCNTRGLRPRRIRADASPPATHSATRIALQVVHEAHATAAALVIGGCDIGLAIVEPASGIVGGRHAWPTREADAILEPPLQLGATQNRPTAGCEPSCPRWRRTTNQPGNRRWSCTPARTRCAAGGRTSTCRRCRATSWSA